MIDIDTIIPIEKVIADTKRFLEECKWVLEIDEHIFELPHDLELVVQTRAFIKANAPDIFLGDHFEAVVLLGREIIDSNWIPIFGHLRLHYDLEGKFISEDRFHKYAG
jgi:hypothetical protein